jgi:hypothetical protein
VTSAERKLWLPFAREVIAGQANRSLSLKAASLISRYEKKRLSKKGVGSGPSSSERREAKRAAHATKTAAIREAVFRRAGGTCEAWRLLGAWWVRCGRSPTDLDHWLNGSGRRRWAQTEGTCWALCRTCHRDRQEYRPTLANWNEAMKIHARLHGYFFTPHIEHAPLLKSSLRPMQSRESP